MTPLLLMIPLYLAGNLHCLGMCGPLVMMLGRHPYRWGYFIGRLASFSLAGALAGSIGEIVNLSLGGIPAAACLVFGFFMTIGGTLTILHIAPSFSFLAPLQKQLSSLLLQEKPHTTFLFGLFTTLLPCGQTLLVLSASALTGDFFIGALNGALFAFLTTPSLLFAMQAHRLITTWRRFYPLIVGSLAIGAGSLSILRGLADLAWIDHLVLNANWHLVIY